jgi:hypothetical protein
MISTSAAGRPGAAGRIGGLLCAGGSSGSAPASETPCPPAPAGFADGPARAVIVDAQHVMGTIRSLQGAHWDPGPAKQALSLNCVAMGVDMIRTHDAGGINGSGTGDIDSTGSGNMFPNLNADPASEASYTFGPSDAMIKDIRDTGARMARSYRDELDKFGFTSAQIVNSEWESSLQGDPMLGTAGNAIFTKKNLM